MSDACSNDRGGDVTSLIDRMSSGDCQAGSELYDLLSEELRAIAEGQFRQARIGPHTLQPTALVNEAWIRLVGASGGIRDRTHFLATSARAMRSVLVDHVRRKQSAKRGGGHVRISLEEASLLQVEQDTDLLALDDALERLAGSNERRARVVELRFFGGLTVEETAEVIESSTATVHREWRLARMWLLNDMGRS